MATGVAQAPADWVGDPFVVMVVNDHDGFPVTGARWKVWQDAELLFDSFEFSVNSYSQGTNTTIVIDYVHTLVEFTGVCNGQDVSQNFGGGLPFYVVDVPFTGDNATSLIPAMTSHTEPSGVASADSEYSFWGPGVYPAWRAFNGQSNNENNAWAPDTDPGEWPPYPHQHGWLKYEFPAPTIVRRYVIRADNFGGGHSGAPAAWTFEGWNGTSWVVLDSHSGAVGNGSYQFSNNTAFIAYRLNMTAAANTATGLQILQLQMFSA